MSAIVIAGGAIVETGTLLKVIAYSLAAGVGISVVVGAGVTSLASLIDAVRDHRIAAGLGWAMVSTVCLAIATAAVVLALVVMAAK